MTRTDCRDLIGQTESTLHERFGPPAARREVGDDVWLVFDLPDIGLRVRLALPPNTETAAAPRVASWTASLTDGCPRLSTAATRVGLWPAAAPDEDAGAVREPLVRRPLPTGGRTLSLTASVRRGLFTHISVFDEAPDWL